MLIKVFCVVSMLNKLGGGGGGGKGLLNKGRGSNRLPGLVTKQQAVEIPQVLIIHNIIMIAACKCRRMYLELPAYPAVPRYLYLDINYKDTHYYQSQMLCIYKHFDLNNGGWG